MRALLDWELIRSSPRDGLSTSYILTKGLLGFGEWMGVVGAVFGPKDLKLWVGGLQDFSVSPSPLLV